VLLGNPDIGSSFYELEFIVPCLRFELIRAKAREILIKIKKSYPNPWLHKRVAIEDVVVIGNMSLKQMRSDEGLEEI